MDFSSVVSTETVSRAKTCPSTSDHGLTCSANETVVLTHACALASQVDLVNNSVEKVDHPDLSISYVWYITYCPLHNI